VERRYPDTEPGIAELVAMAGHGKDETGGKPVRMP
jgi:hypothetical protein